MKKIISCLILSFFILIGIAFAWEGYDMEVGEYVKIDMDGLPQEDEEIEVYHSKTGKSKKEIVQSVSCNETEGYSGDSSHERNDTGTGASCQITTYDPKTNQNHTYTTK